MSEKFNENNRNDLIKRGFSEEDVSYLESFEYDKTDLYNKICNKIDNFGTSPDKIIMQLKNAVQEELKKQSITNSKQSVEEPHQVKNVEEENKPEAVVGGVKTQKNKHKNKNKYKKTKRSRNNQKGKKSKKGRKANKNKKTKQNK